MKWVVISDSNLCQIYSYNSLPNELISVKKIYHPENKLKTQDLTSDLPGRYRATGNAHGVYTQRTDPKEVKIDTFAREIADVLDDGRKNQLFEKLIIIAPPHIHGLITQHLNKNVKELVTHNIQKDLLHLPQHELIEFLKENARFSA